MLTVWAVAIYAAEFYHVVQPLSSLGLSVDNNGVINNVVDPFDDEDQSPAARAGLQPGDRIDLHKMTCLDPYSAACASLLPVLDFSGELEFTRSGFTATYDILSQPDGKPRRVTLQAAPAPMAWVDRLILFVNTIAGLLFVGAAFFLVWQRAGPMSWGFFLYAIWFNPGQNYTFHMFLQPWPLLVLAQQVAEAFAQGAGYAGLLIFAIRFPTDAIAPGWRRVETLSLWLGAALAVLTLAWGGDLFTIPTQTLTNIVFFAGFAVDALALVILVLRLGTLHPQDEQRMLWAIAGCVIGIPCFLIADICQSTNLPTLLGLNPSQAFVGLLYLLQGVMAYFVGIAMYRRRVVSVTIPLRRGATLTLLTFLLGVPILYLHEKITEYSQHRDLPDWLWPLVLGPTVLVLLARLQDSAAVYTERVFNRRYHRARITLQKAVTAIEKAANFEEVDSLLTVAPATALRLASVAVFRLIGDRLHRVGPSIGWSDEHIRFIDPVEHQAFLQQLREDKPIRLPRSEWERPSLPRDDLYPCLAVPLRGGVSESFAVIFCGPHLSGADISFDERHLLRDFVSRAALSYDRVEANDLRQQIQRLQASSGQLVQEPPPEQKLK